MVIDDGLGLGRSVGWLLRGGQFWVWSVEQKLRKISKRGEVRIVARNKQGINPHLITAIATPPNIFSVSKIPEGQSKR